jgi:hypothetical protein
LFLSSRLALLEARRDQATGAKPGVIVGLEYPDAARAKRNKRWAFALCEKSFQVAEGDAVASGDFPLA